MKRLEGRVCVITGAGSGIGRASALRFAQEGGVVLAVGRSATNTHETAELVRAAGGRAGAMVADATAEPDVEAVVARALAEFGALDVFFANAGTPGTNAGMLEQTVEEWNEVWRVNVVSCMLAVKHAGRAMVEEQTVIIPDITHVEGIPLNVYLATFIRSLIAVFEASQATLGNRLALNLPGLNVTVQQMLDALEKVAGKSVRERVRFERDERIAGIVGNWARGASSERAHALGLQADTSFESIIEQYIADCRSQSAYPAEALKGL